MLASKLLVANKPVVNLRKEPLAHSGKPGEDPLQETQLLLGESLLGLKEKEGWLFVHAPHQPYFKDGAWSGYPGWVSREDVIEVSNTQEYTVIVKDHGAPLETEKGVIHLSAGTMLEHVDETWAEYEVLLPDHTRGKIAKLLCYDMSLLPDDPREAIITSARTFTDMPYLWGGRSSYMPASSPVSSVDCSGLTHIVHSMQGITIPRNAHDQYLRALRLEPDDLEPGDLVFTAKLTNTGHMTHVMIYAGDDMLIEAASAVGKVHEISAREKLGAPIRSIPHGTNGPNSYVCYGTFLQE